MSEKQINEDLKKVDAYLSSMSETEKETEFGIVLKIAHRALYHLLVKTDSERWTDNSPIND